MPQWNCSALTLNVTELIRRNKCDKAPYLLLVDKFPKVISNFQPNSRTVQYNPYTRTDSRTVIIHRYVDMYDTVFSVRVGRARHKLSTGMISSRTVYLYIYIYI
jgi:hypothetical protein